MTVESIHIYIYIYIYIAGSMKVNLLNARFKTILHILFHKIKTIFPFSSLPQLMERKKSIDMHTNIATALLDKIRVRENELSIATDELAVIFCRQENWICFLTWKKN